jgi:hypothetical protein
MSHISTEEEKIEHQEKTITTLLKPYGLSVHKEGPDSYVFMGDKGQPHTGPGLTLAELSKLAFDLFPRV